MSEFETRTYEHKRRRVTDVQRRRQFGALIRARRVAMNMKQIDLAEKVKISNKTLFNIESGQNWPSMMVYVKMCRELGCTDCPPFFTFANLSLVYPV